MRECESDYTRSGYVIMAEFRIMKMEPSSSVTENFDQEKNRNALQNGANQPVNIKSTQLTTREGISYRS
jgi:hypothetical protein